MVGNRQMIILARYACYTFYPWPLDDKPMYVQAPIRATPRCCLRRQVSKIGHSVSVDVDLASRPRSLLWWYLVRDENDVLGLFV